MNLDEKSNNDSDEKPPRNPTAFDSSLTSNSRMNLQTQNGSRDKLVSSQTKILKQKTYLSSNTINIVYHPYSQIDSERQESHQDQEEISSYFNKTTNMGKHAVTPIMQKRMPQGQRITMSHKCFEDEKIININKFLS